MKLFIHKYLSSVVRETLLLLRDRAGLMMLFLMPAALVLIMTLLQDSTFRVLEEKKVPVLILDQDRDTFGIHIVDGLTRSKFFEVTDISDQPQPDEARIRRLINDGTYQIGIIIRQGASDSLRALMQYTLVRQFPADLSGLSPDDSTRTPMPATIDVFFDPVIKYSFRQAIISAIQQYSWMVQGKVMFDVYSVFFDDLLGVQLQEQHGMPAMVTIRESMSTKGNKPVIPNSVQHNVPAWAVFAMFFVVIPIAGTMIRERQSGVALRLRTMPGSNLPMIMAKVSTYTVIILIQAILMLLMGLYLLPRLGLPGLEIGSDYPALIILTLAIALAASGYGILIGTGAGSQEQASIFGSLSVVILAAIGGIWVPGFMMSDTMQTISSLSPLNWSLNGYYDILLREASTTDIAPYLLRLLLFFVVTIGVGWYLDHIRNHTS